MNQRSTAPAQPKPYPAGTYCLLASNKPILPEVLAMDYICGYRVRTSWIDVQPQMGAIITDYIDSQIELAASKKRKIGLGIPAGVSSPPELFAMGVDKFTLSPDNVTIETMPPDMPLPWDEKFRAEFFKLLDEFGEKYDGNPTVSYFVIGGIMQLMENRFVMEENDVARVEELALAAGYDNFGAAWLAGAQEIVSYYIATFPSTPLILSTARVAPGIYKTLGDDLVAWAKEQYPAHFGTMTCTLKALPAPHPAPTAPLPAFPKGDQPIYASFDVERFYLPETTPVPFPDAPQPVDDLLGHAVTTQQDMWVELYEADAKVAANGPVIIARNEQFRALAKESQRATGWGQ